MLDGKTLNRGVGDPPGPAAEPGRVLCVGGLVIDRTYRAFGAVRPGTSNPVSGSRSFGGVAGNVATNLARLAIRTSLASMVGEDESGRALLRHAEGLGIATAAVGRSPHGPTAEYIALLGPDGELALAMADMALFDRIGPAQVLPHLGGLASGDWIFADCNPPPDTLAVLMDRHRRGPARLAVDVVSTPKSERLPRILDGIDLLFLNRDEAASILRLAPSALRPEDAVATLLDRGAGAVVLTLGAEGLVAGETGVAGGSVVRIAATASRVIDVTGAGDALVAATLAMLARGLSLADAARWGGVAAALTLAHAGSTDPALCIARLVETAGRPLFAATMDLA